MKYPVITATMLSKNGTRHPQLRNCSAGKDENIRKISAESSSEIITDAGANEPNKPRRPGGAYSEANRIAPANSPPAPKPCTIRKPTRRIGAQTPTEA